MKIHSVFQPIYPKTSGQKLSFTGLAGSSVALTIANLAKQSQQSLFIITPDNYSAQCLEAEIPFFGNDLSPCILHFPDWETLPYDIFSPHQDIISNRLKTLYQLPKLKQSILITSITTLMHRLAPTTHLNQFSFVLQTGDRLAIETFRSQLQKNGYHAVQQVVTHGEFTCRGSIIDIFPMGSDQPLRIDLLGDEVDSLRYFDPQTQRSLEKIECIKLLPAHEFPFTPQDIQLFKLNWREQFTGHATQCPIYQSVSQGLLAPGIEYYLPLFFNHMETLLDYLHPNTLVLSLNDGKEPAEHFWHEITERYEQRRHDITRPLLSPSQLFLTPEQVFSQLKTFSQIRIKTTSETPRTNYAHFATQPLPDVTINHQLANPLKNLDAFIRPLSYRTLILAETTGRREILMELLKKSQHPLTLCQNWEDFLHSDAPFCLTVAPLERGFCLTGDTPLALIPESQLLSQSVMQRRFRKSRQSNVDALVRDLAELNVGTLVVHQDHGIGRYLGLQVITLDEIPTEFLTLEYQGGDKLYVPIFSLHLLSRYTGGTEEITLHRLGTEQWQKAKRKAQEQVKDVAAELLEIYAKREAHEGFAFQASPTEYAKFAASFPFELTADQEQAINEVLKDMATPHPMDRVICGDVGFGKTEVAMRAAFTAVNNDKQVAVLVPTTLLAQQHLKNFQDRFADWGIHIDVISRFRTAKEQAAIIEKVAHKQIDILIGTHKLLQSDLKFETLGLLIIDEEHRFGVQQKERFKNLRSQVDILTLTATPIPRTLNMAFANLRSLSIIATPPLRRLSIKTFVHESNPTLLKDAILRELLRGGQVYFVHNQVETIEKTAETLRKLVPEARVDLAHGQMREKDLERIMADFYHQRFNVLVCTTIIETGIDIPSANTIIIDRADRFGLAQLHQLRGRVGRSHHQAYAYLLIPTEASMSKDAKKRLDAIASFEALGAGFALATHDLEIRGAGELLGEQQSGTIQSIGFSLYRELLERAIASLKQGKKIIDFESLQKTYTEIDLKIPALIPDQYLADVHLRLTFYKRIATANDQTQLDDIAVEMIDRFGLLPSPTHQLFRVHSLKIKAEPLGIVRIEAHKNGGIFHFNEKPTLDPVRMLHLIQTEPSRFKLDGPKRLRFYFDEPKEGEARIDGVEKVLTDLG